MRNAGRFFIGALLMIGGLLVILNIAGVFSFDIFFPGWWSIFIMLPCLFGLITGHGDRIGSLFGLTIGIFCLLAANGIIDWGNMWKCVLASLAFTFGLRIIFGFNCDHQAKEEIKSISRDGKDIKKYNCSFGKSDISYDQQVFEGAEINASFGAVTLDLRNAIINDDVVIKVNCSFMGLEILVPTDYNVKVCVSCGFGGVDKEKLSDNPTSEHTIYIDGNCSFGGIEIK